MGMTVLVKPAVDCLAIPNLGDRPPRYSFSAGTRINIAVSGVVQALLADRR